MLFGLYFGLTLAYPTNKIDTQVLYWVPFNLRSFDSELSLPLTMAFLSRKLRKYMSHRIGWIAMLATT